jgi:hypothetical protein
MGFELEQKIEKFATEIAIEWSLLDMISLEDDDDEYGEEGCFPSETEENNEIIDELISLGYLYLYQIKGFNGSSDEKKYDESRSKAIKKILDIQYNLQIERRENYSYDSDIYRQNIISAINYYEVFIYQEFSQYEEYKKREQS